MRVLSTITALSLLLLCGLLIILTPSTEAEPTDASGTRDDSPPIVELFSHDEDYINIVYSDHQDKTIFVNGSAVFSPYGDNSSYQRAEVSFYPERGDLAFTIEPMEFNLTVNDTEVMWQCEVAIPAATENGEYVISFRADAMLYRGGIGLIGLMYHSDPVTFVVEVSPPWEGPMYGSDEIGSDIEDDDWVGDDVALGIVIATVVILLVAEFYAAFYAFGKTPLGPVLKGVYIPMSSFFMVALVATVMSQYLDSTLGCMAYPTFGDSACFFIFLGGILQVVFLIVLVVQGTSRSFQYPPYPLGYPPGHIPPPPGWYEYHYGAPPPGGPTPEGPPQTPPEGTSRQRPKRSEDERRKDGGTRDK